MWERKELKKAAKVNVRKNYWAMIAVCFMLAFVASEYTMTTSVMNQYGEVAETQKIAVQQKTQGNMFQSVGELYSGITGGKAIFESIPKGSKGFLSGVINGVSSGTAVIRLAVDSFGDFLFKHKIAEGFFSILAILISLGFLIFVQGILKIGERRFILESRLYHETHIFRMLFLYRRRTLWNPAKIMILRVLYTGLWSLTIVGGVIKYYQYKMIPYILAENPDMSRQDAFRLTMEMTYGNKWKMFCLQMSFAGWFGLLLLTGGLSGVFYGNPYYRATEAELYIRLRANVLAQCADEGVFFNDVPLIYPQTDEPQPLYPGLVEEKKHDFAVNFRRNYSLLNLALMFMSFAVIGWVWEVVFYFVQDGTFVNRGTMHGPWLPIYGTGGVVVLILLKRLREKPVVLFISSMGICGVIEYFSSWALEVFKGQMYWDYSGYFLNLNGRICLEGLLVFGIACSLCVYIIAPRLDELYEKIPPGIKYAILGVLWSAFGCDMVYSHLHPNVGDGITDNLK